MKHTKPPPNSKKTDQRIAILIECLEEAMPFKIACHYAQIDASTLWRWKKEDSEFAMKVQHARSKAERMLIKNVIAEKSSWKLLKCHDPEHFKDEMPQLTQNNYKLIVNTTNGPVDLSGNVRHNEEPQAEQRLPIE